MKNTKLKKLNKKNCAVAVFMLLSLGLMVKLGTKIFGKAITSLVAENAENKKPDTDNNDTVAVDTVARPMVQFSNLQQSMYAEFQGFSYVYPNGSRLVWAPFVVLKPTITIRDNFVLGFTTTQMAQTYTGDQMGMMMHNVFINAQYKLKNNNALVATMGKLQTQNYAGQFAKYMPISEYFSNAMVLGSGHTLPSVGLVGFKNPKFSVSAGYAEYGCPFMFNGGGDFVVGGEVFLNNVKIGTLWVLNTNKCVGDVQITYNGDKQSGLLEFTGIGGEILAVHGLYVVNLNPYFSAFGNAYTQLKTDGGMYGANIGVRHELSGVYVTFGSAYNEPLLSGGDRYAKLTPTFELGIRRGLVPTR